MTPVSAISFMSHDRCWSFAGAPEPRSWWPECRALDTSRRDPPTQSAAAVPPDSLPNPPRSATAHILPDPDLSEQPEPPLFPRDPDPDEASKPLSYANEYSSCWAGQTRTLNAMIHKRAHESRFPTSDHRPPTSSFILLPSAFLLRHLPPALRPPSSACFRRSRFGLDQFEAQSLTERARDARHRG